MLALDPNDRRADDVVRWLAAQRDARGWRSTRTTGPVAIALAEYLGARPAEFKPQYVIDATWNGANVLSRTFTPADVFGVEALHVSVPLDHVQPGANKLEIKKNGSGVAYWAWTARAMVPSPGPALPPGQISIAREYLHAERTADRRGRPQLIGTPLDPAQPVRIGESILVRLTIHSAKGARHVMIEDPRASGCEIEDLAPQGAERPWALHAEARDDRAVFFLDTVDDGDTVIEYLVRPEVAGAFTALPTTASGMYDPLLRARGAEARIAVVEK